MNKLLSILIAGVFAVTTGSVFAASHVKAAGDKTEMTKEAKPAEAKPAPEKKAKKTKKATKAAKAKAEEMKK